MLAPVPETHFFALDDGGVLFCEPAQRFYDLNSTAALSWLALSDGVSESAAIAELVAAGAPKADARSWWEQSLALFAAEGFLAGEPGRQRDLPPLHPPGIVEGQLLERIPPCSAHRLYRLFDTRFRVGFTNEAAIASVEGMLARLADAGGQPADVEITLIGVGERYLIARGMTVVGVVANLAGLMARLEMVMVLTAIDTTPHLLSLHAGVLAKGGCGLMLPAPSGSGKTTLTAALNRHGWNFGTDEITLLEIGAHDLRVAPLSACTKEGSWPILDSRFPSLAGQPVHERAGRRVRYLPPVGRTIERCRATHVVFPRYAAEGGGAAALTPLSRSAGLRRLFAECVSVPRRLSAQEAGQMVDWVRDLKFFDLTLADLSAALASIDLLAAEES